MVAQLQVQCLQEVIRTGSFRAAAHALGISQPAVSGQIAKLERELNLLLLARGSAGSVLTHDGERIMPHLRAFVDMTEQIRRASEHIQHDPPQHLTVVGETRRIHAALPHVLAEVGKTFTNLTVSVLSADLESICAELRTGQTEVGVYGYEHDTIGLADDIVTIPVVKLGPIGVSYRADHPVLSVGEGPIDMHDLPGNPMILFTEFRSNDVVDRLIPEAVRGPIWWVDDVATGMGLLHHGMADMLLSGGTSRRADPTVGWRAIAGAPEFSTALAHKRGVDLSPVARSFIDRVTRWCANSSPFHYDPASGRMLDGW